jgi:hypothetical protein
MTGASNVKAIEPVSRLAVTTSENEPEPAVIGAERRTVVTDVHDVVVPYAV